MEKLIKELEEELLNKEMTLLELDNEAERITGSESSIFDYSGEIKAEGSGSYYINEYDKEIVIEYTAVDKTEEEVNNMSGDEKLELKVKVTSIWED